MTVFNYTRLTIRLLLTIYFGSDAMQVNKVYKVFKVNTVVI
ncbi:hypothetical protein BH10BAC3_BH10BAC3_25510 [soil metagenome]